MSKSIEVNAYVSGTGFDGATYKGIVDEIGETFVLLKPKLPHYFRRCLTLSTVTLAAPSLPELPE